MKFSVEFGHRHRKIDRKVGSLFLVAVALALALKERKEGREEGGRRKKDQISESCRI
jgi:hypothetical protein